MSLYVAFPGVYTFLSALTVIAAGPPEITELVQHTIQDRLIMFEKLGWSPCEMLERQT